MLALAYGVLPSVFIVAIGRVVRAHRRPGRAHQPGREEIRVLNLLPWLRQRYDREIEDTWSRCGVVGAVLFRQFLVYTGIGFLIAVTAFVLLGQGFTPAQGVVFLTVAIQAILVPLRFGTYFPECDMQTQYGMQCQSTIGEFPALAGRPAGSRRAADGGGRMRAEVDFYERFLELTEGLTTLVISHRFSTVRRADRIAVLSEGRISESGSHDELLDADGTYASMFRVQRDRFTAALARGMTGEQHPQRPGDPAHGLADGPGQDGQGGRAAARPPHRHAADARADVHSLRPSVVLRARRDDPGPPAAPPVHRHQLSSVPGPPGAAGLRQRPAGHSVPSVEPQPRPPSKCGAARAGRR